MPRQPTKNREVVWLRFDLSDASRKYINEYLASEYPDHEKVTRSLSELMQRADKVLMNRYNGQMQVTAYFPAEDDRVQYAVSGLGNTLDLAVLACFVKGAFEAKWEFKADDERGSVSDLPEFS